MKFEHSIFVKTKAVLFGLAALIGFALFAFYSGVEKTTPLEYKVINVQGNILYVQTGSEMKRGDTYLEGTGLSFKTKDARAAIMNKTAGRMVLTGNDKGKIRILPAQNNISSRSGALLNLIDLKSHFSGRYLVLGRTEVEIASPDYIMNDRNFFYLRYDFMDESIPKRLENNGNKLIIDKSQIFKIDGEPIPTFETEMTLYYSKEGNNTKISKFTPVFLDLETLKEELTLMFSIFEFKDEEAKYNEVKAHLNEFYGTPHDDDLKTWLNQEFNTNY